MSYSDFSGPGAPPTEPVPGDLAGDIRFSLSTHHTSFFIQDRTALLVEQRLTPGVRYARWVSCPNELLDHALPVLQRRLLEQLRPWRRPDLPAFPYMQICRRSPWRSGRS